MTYKFKSIGDVEAVKEPSDSANILIEEDGVIKKAPKSSVGGEKKWDAIIELGNTPYAYGAFRDALLVSGDYNELCAKIKSGDMPNILIRWNYNYGYDVFQLGTPSLVSIKEYETNPKILVDYYFSDFYINYDNTISQVTPG